MAMTGTNSGSAGPNAEPTTSNTASVAKPGHSKPHTASEKSEQAAIAWVWEGNGHWTLEHFVGNQEWHGWGPEAARAPVMYFRCLRMLRDPRDGLKATKACAKVIKEVDKHRKKKGCGCEIAWLGGRMEVGGGGDFFGAGVRDRPGKMLRCRWSRNGTGGGVYKAMDAHDQVCDCRCFGVVRAGCTFCLFTLF